MKADERIKFFGLNNLSINSAIRKVERELKIAIQPRTTTEEKDEEFYPQFPEEIRQEAEAMARNYEIFYCLEVSIRQLVSGRLQKNAGPIGGILRFRRKLRRTLKQIAAESQRLE